MAISAKEVKQLRDKTGAGMMDCKKALTESEGDVEKAIEILRKKGAATAAKRADRDASEGIVLTKILDDNTGVMVEVNCETDFVAKSDDFVNFANTVLSAIVNERPANTEELLELEVDGKKLADSLNEVTGKIGEKIEVNKFVIEKPENGFVTDYVHHGSKLGVLLRVDNAEAEEEIQGLAKDFAMQVAAMRPEYVSNKSIPEDVVNRELEIYKDVARQEGKPEQILEKIAMGKLNKFYSEVCLLNQSSVKDNSKTVQGLIDDYNKKKSAEAKLTLFHRFHLGESK